MIKTPLSTVIGGAFWTPKATILGGTSKTFDQIIKALFSNNEQGFFYDPNDLSTMFRDATGTTPVTGVGQPVGLIKDKSGRNNHAYQTTSASRPILRKNAETGANYLEFDGSDDFLQTANINFTATDKVSLFAGVRKLSDVSRGTVIELSANVGFNNGTFNLFAPVTNGSSDYSFTSKGTVSCSATSVGFAAPNSSVLRGVADITNKTVNLFANQNIAASSLLDQGSGNYGNYPIYIGRRGGTSAPFNGHIYSLIGVGRLTTESETVAIEKELAKRTGVILSV